MIKLTAIGHLGSDATIKEAGGKKVINFSIAHSEKYKNKDQVQVERTVWVECAIWERDNLAPHLKKGTLVYVEGMPEANAYSNKEGKPAASLRLRVMNLQLLSAAPKKDAGGHPVTDNAAATTANYSPAPESVDDLPF